MPILILNGSPRTKGLLATTLATMRQELESRGKAVTWVDVYSLNMKPCLACMQCRPDGTCALPHDDAHLVGDMLRESTGLILGSPTHWGNMSAMLKLLLDRNVPAVMGAKPNGMPLGRHKGQPAALVATCTTPRPFHLLPSQGRGAIRAMKTIIQTGGWNLKGSLILPGTRTLSAPPANTLAKARTLADKLI